MGIDQLQGGSPLPTEDGDTRSHYRILVSGASTRPVADFYLFNVGDRIPSFGLPLRQEDTDPVGDLQLLVLYDLLAY